GCVRPERHIATAVVDRRHRRRLRGALAPPSGCGPDGTPLGRDAAGRRAAPVSARRLTPAEDPHGGWPLAATGRCGARAGGPPIRRRWPAGASRSRRFLFLE